MATCNDDYDESHGDHCNEDDDNSCLHSPIQEWKRSLTQLNNIEWKAYLCTAAVKP